MYNSIRFCRGRGVGVDRDVQMVASHLQSTMVPIVVKCKPSGICHLRLLLSNEKPCQ